MSDKIEQALQILKDFRLPSAQLNDRSALCLLALLDIKADSIWSEAKQHLIGVTPIMKFCEKEYHKLYAPNSRETFRRFTLHQFVEAGITECNPDNPSRPINSPKTVYHISESALEIIQAFGRKEYSELLKTFFIKQKGLIDKYAMARDSNRIPVKFNNSIEFKLSPGDHSELINRILTDLAPIFLANSQLLYVGDTETKWSYYDKESLSKLGIEIEGHGKMPDVILFMQEKRWLCLIEAVTSHGPIDSKRYLELSNIFKNNKDDLVFISAFPDRKTFNKFSKDIAWETEVWLADNPTHMIHFNGEKFLGPYTNK